MMNTVPELYLDLWSDFEGLDYGAAIFISCHSSTGRILLIGRIFL